MPKELNKVQVSLDFTANASKAKQEIATLQQELRKIQTTPTNLFDDAQLKKASIAARELEGHLKSAMNSDTGKLDLSRFAASLKSSNKQLSDYKRDLFAIGPTGQQAFLKLSQSIANAEAPLLRSNKLLTNFATTLKNTAKWQLSSSILHGFMGSIQHAYRYAQDLDESLNSIRIVTGQSTDQMAKFAEKANNAAKALNTTTTAYTDAALIFYQQGLGDDEVQKRTDATIKMANVTGDASKEVSSYMTAIWNNFAKGSDNLDLFGDKITALGAATASSSAEIAEGLEKFAAIGNTIGLSYDYATSALATVVATTRQSADSVGTAFKTIFARLQGLSLGETLEDGTNLNKYSKALDAAGIQIKDQSGELKKTDMILNEMAAKWQTMSKDQQVALAQTVAGVRQYTQLVALMDNWDFMERNLDIVGNAEGTLDKQAEIYAESWEASRKRVKAALEDIYSTLIDNEFFINLNNTFATLLEGVNGFTKGLGGAAGILGTVGGLIIQHLAKDAPAALEKIKQNLFVISGQANKNASNELSGLTASLDQKSNNNLTASNFESKNSAIVASLKQQLLLRNDLSKAERDSVEFEIERLNSITEINKAKTEELRILQNENSLRIDKAVDRAARTSANDIYGDQIKTKADQDYAFESQKQIIQDARLDLEYYYTALKKVEAARETISKQTTIWEKESLNLEKGSQEYDKIKNKIQDYALKLKETGQITEQTFNKNFGKNQGVTELLNNLKNIEKELVIVDENGDKIKFQGIEQLNNEVKKLKEELFDLGLNPDLITNGIDTITERQNNLTNALETYDERAREIPAHQVKLSESFMNTASAIMSFSSLLTSVKSTMDTLSNPDTTGLEKFSAVAGMLMTTMFAYSSISKAILSLEIVQIAVKNEKNKAITKEALNQALANKERAYNIMLSLAETPAELAAAKAEYAKAEAELADAAAAHAAALANKGLLASLGPIVLAITAIVTVVWLLVKAYKAMEAASPAGQLKAAEEQALKTAEAFDRVKQSIDDSTNSVNNLKDAVEKLANTDAGSFEWNEQLIKANEEIDTLLSKYNNADLNLEQYITRGRNGSLNIADEFYKIIEQEQIKQLNAASINNNISKNRVNDKKIDIVRNNFNNLSKQKSYGEYTGAARSFVEGQVTEDLSKMTNAPNKFSQYKFDDRILEELDNYFINSRRIKPNFDYKNYIAEKIGVDENSEDYSVLVKRINEIDKEYQKNRLEIQRLAKENAELSIRQAENSVASIGSNRDLSFFGLQNGFDSILKDARERAKETINAGAAEDGAWVDAALKGDGLARNQVKDLVVNIDGSISYTADGEEVKKTAEEVEDIVTSYFASDDFETKARKSFTKSIGNALSGTTADIDFDSMTVEMLASMDNAFANLGNIVGENNLSKIITDEVLNDVGSVEDLSDLINGIDLQDPEKFRAFGNAIQEFTNSIEPDKVATFTNELRELNALTQIDNMGGYFKDAAERYGFSEDDAAKMQQYAKHLMTLADNSNELSNDLDTSAEAAAALSVQIYRMNKGIETLAKGIDEWSDILKKSTKESQEYFDALYEIEKALSDVLDVDIDSFDTQFITDNLDLIKEAATGSGDAIDELRVKLSQNIIAQIKIDNSELIASIGTTEEAIDNLYNDIWDKLNDFQAGPIDNIGFIESLQSLIDATGMTVEQFNALADSMGIEAKFETADIQQNSQIPVTTKYHTIADQVYEDKQLVQWTEHEYATTTYQQANQVIPAAAIAMGSKASGVGTPKISGANKKLKGSANNYSSKNAGGKSPSGKSGGGGGSKKETKDTKQYKDEFDIYHDLQRAIDETSDAISDLNRVQSHLFGPELANNLKQESKLLEQQSKNYKALAAAQKGQMDIMQVQLKEYGFAFNAASGEIVNYAAITLKMLDEYNKAIAAYNASAQSETEKAALESAEKRYEEFKKILELYESTLDNHRDAVNEAEQKAIDAIGKNLEAFTVEIEFKIDTKELEMTIKKFNQSLDEDFQKHFRNIKAEIEGIADILPDKQAQINTRQDKMMEYQSEMKLWQSGKLDGADLSQYAGQLLFASRSEAENAYREAQKEYMEAVEDFKSTVVDAWDKYLEGIDQVMERFDDFMDQFDDINDVLENQIDIIQLLYGEDSYDRLGLAYDTLQANGLARMEAVRKELGVWQNFYDSIEDKDNEDAVKALERIRELQSQINNEIVDYLNTITNKYTNTISKIFKDLDKGITGGKGTNWIKTQWDDAKYAAEGYYDDVQRITELTKLRNRFEQAVSDANGLKGQQKLKELLDQQMNILEDKSKLSEYDVTLAEKRLAVLQAQIALEESQNNKNSMKLTRDQSGNWTYNYVVDQDNVRDKENDLLNASSDYYDFTKESWADMTEEIWNDIETMQERLSELMEEYKYADEARRVQIEEQINYIKDYYLGENGIIANKVKELENYETNLNIATFETLKSLYRVDEYNYTLMTDKEKELADLLKQGVIQNYEEILIKTTEVNEESINLWNTTAEEIIRLWNGGTDSIRGQVEEALALCGDAQREFDDAVKRGEEASGIAYTQTTQIMEQQRSKIQELSSEHSRYVSQATSELSGLQSAIRGVIDMYNQMAAAARAAMAAEAAAKSVSATPNPNASATNSTSSSSSANSGGGANGNTGESPSKPAAKPTITEYYANYEQGSQGYTRVASSSTIDGVKNILAANASPGTYSIYAKYSDKTSKKVDSYMVIGVGNNRTTSIDQRLTNQMKTYATGGYTGSWSDGGVDTKNGKMAILHQKELVLNASDTENMLEAVNTVRDISSIGASISTAIANGISGIIGQIVNNDNIKNYNTSNSNTFGDNVFNITAEFPNADDVTSIREAILGLPNLASQYLGRR